MLAYLVSSLLFAAPAADSRQLLIWSALDTTAEPAPVVVYVHGYRTDAKTAIKEHRLFEQFAASKRNAVFIVPQAPSGPAQPVYFDDLDALLERAERELGRPLSRESIVLAGHSGAYRTLRGWVDHPGVREIILFDAMYGDTEPFARWIKSSADARLTIISHSTLKSARAFLSRIDRELIESGRVVHRRVAAGHMEIITGGELIPEYLNPRRPERRTFGAVDHHVPVILYDQPGSTVSVGAAGEQRLAAGRV